MPSLAEKLLLKAKDKSPDATPASTLGRMFRRSGVTRTADFERILYIARRDWREGAAELARNLTTVYGREPQNCTEDCVCRGKGYMALKPVQAASLSDIHDFGGLFAPITVGGGKTLVSFLTSKICGSERPLLLIRANLREKTEREWWKYATHWQLPPLRIETYEKLGNPRNAHLIENYDPDLIFADEAHRLRNTSAGCTRRVKRFLERKANEGQRVRFVAASGTLSTKAIRDYWHLLKWCLGGELMPLPVKFEEMIEWGECLDVGSDRAIRMAPGCLAEFCPEHPVPTLEQVRDGYRRRLIQTPGVIATDEQDGFNGSLEILGTDVPGFEAVAKHYETLRTKWQTPDGWDFSDAVELWRHARELACGFYNIWDPRPPDLWMDKRRNWHKFVRAVLSHSRTFDTESQVASAVARGLIKSVFEVMDADGLRDADVYAEWVDIRDTFKPNVVPVWVDDTTLSFASQWLTKDRGICWTEHPCFGEKLSALTGFPYHGRKGLDARGHAIEDASGPIIASVLANGEGRNLQRWHKNLVVSCPPNGKVKEQLLGRTHRFGQESDEVSYMFILACREQVVGFYKAVREAEFVEQTQGQPQKLLFADRTGIPTPDELSRKIGSRW